MIVAAPSDYRALARRRLPRFLFDYIDGGAYSEATLRANRDDLDAIALRQRVLKDVSDVSLETELFGQRLAMPIALGPVGLSGMYARRGEVQAARAAERAGIPFTLSTMSVCPLAEVADAVERPFWFQLYMVRDRAFMRDLLSAAAAAGCSALVFTVDLPVPGTRYRDYRSGMAGASAGGLRRLGQAISHPGWALDVGLRGKPHTLGNLAPVLGGKTGLEDFLGWIGANFDPGVTWADLDFIRSHWSGPLIIKGILDVEDAREAAALQADGLVVSNHGGRQLDGAVSTARALPAIADAAGDRMTILADGGIRSGLDVVRMIALGADGVMLGRAWAYALAGAGQAGVEHVLALMRAEMSTAMALTGVTRIDQIDPSMLAR
ncbi:MAG: FMN-dependent L-lactate dehydrogenase LldD [Gemmatales bacterium]